MARFRQTLRKTQALVASLTLLCGLFMMWGSARGAVEDSGNQRYLRGELVEIDSLVPSSVNNGSVVLASGRFSSPQQLEDEFLVAGKYLILKRRVEMFQWMEEKSSSAGQAEYRLGWYEGQIDFFSFSNPTGHENPLLRYEPFTKSVDSAMFGGFDGAMLMRSVRLLLPLELRANILKDPSVEIQDNKLVIRRSPAAGEGVQLGDMRVWYEVLPQGDYTVLARQVDERSLIGAQPTQDMVLRAGVFSANEFFKAHTEESQKVLDGLLYLGGFLFFIGLYSILAPFSAGMTLRPKLQLDGSAALLVICAVLALVAVSIFFVVGRFG